jgi:hypothetical protein
MGIPPHYSQALPERCLHLIETLLPSVRGVCYPGEEYLGPLTTTFLLAMSTPMIALPIERIEKHRELADEAYMDERLFNPVLTKEVDQALGGRELKRSPFFEPDRWRFATMAYGGQNLARHFPDDLSETLSRPEALRAASDMPANQWASCLRNALAHGGVCYLDSSGRQSFGQSAKMLAFVSAKYPKNDGRKPPEQLKILRITEEGYLSFVRLWVEWLRSSGLSHALAA